MKLKKLILSGFKSFADRTEFEFDDGISCVVGPNGCGKSNIVDAVKWVLGEQSAKSLRGSEMLDVIFNGSSARRASGLAEVTLVFDNDTGLLQPNIESEAAANGVVSVTRRLYRNGQSEYLINKSQCRLRDIREMFMDTGVGVDAYSLIEQGRVEVFLQASQDERRAIFDEAAGISKYKARKKEALRKLDRVEQNLLRLNDVLGEVDKRLRSIKYQAGKARNYQTYSQRLNELKSLYYLAQYHTHSSARGELQQKLTVETDGLSGITSRIDQLEAARSSADMEILEQERAARELQEKTSGVAASILAAEQRAEMLTARVKELGEQMVVAAAQGEALEAKIAEAAAQAEARTDEVRQLEAHSVRLSERYEALRAEHDAGELAIVHLQAQLEDEKAGTIDLLRRTAQLHNEIHGLGIRKENLGHQQSRLTDRSEQIAESLKGLHADRAGFEAKLNDVREVLGQSQAKFEQTKLDSQQAHDAQESVQKQLSEAREERSALESRMNALSEMQARLEGVSEGVRRVMQARSDGRLAALRGMIGESVRTDTQHAGIVEAALAGADQCLYVERFDELASVRDELAEVLGKGGSVEIICLDRLESYGSDFDLSTCPQAIARVIDWARFGPEVAPAMWRLLGRTLVVRDLHDAAEAAGAVPAGTRFVTMSGEVLEADGRVRLGAATRAAGMIARRSELDELQQRLAALGERIDALAQQHSDARNECEHLERLAQQLRTAIYEANTERVECESRLGQYDTEIQKFEREAPLVAQDINNLVEEIAQAVRAEHEAKDKAAELESLNAQRQQAVEQLTEQINAARGRQDELAAGMTDQKVALAAAEQKTMAVKEAIGALNRQREQMQRDLEAQRAQLQLDRQRRADAEASIAAARAEVDNLYARKEELDKDAQEIAESRRGLAERIEDIRKQLAEHRKSAEAAAERLNALKVELSETDVRIENLISRANDEMQMDLLSLREGYEHDEQRDWDEVDAEIQTLRGKIDRLGNVNLDAIAEQDELEQRREFLGGQLADVDASRNQLNELIRKINRESRDMFTETFEQVRENFQELFRKLFGGGRADIILVDPEDVLETGIEIIARPPGKETRTLSLLSGGEKTMTALALLFSIFRSRPSPFCLLDEVDAALDEANNHRFNALVNEFVSTSQFIVITHSKPSMSMANVLYGVTMQEAGVSRRISVRFEEAAENLDSKLEPASA